MLAEKAERWRAFRLQILRDKVRGMLVHSRLEASLERETIDGGAGEEEEAESGGPGGEGAVGSPTALRAAILRRMGLEPAPSSGDA